MAISCKIISQPQGACYEIEGWLWKWPSTAKWFRSYGPAFFTFWDFAAVSQLRNEGHCAAKWHSCAKNGFAAKWLFRSEVAIPQRTCWGCEMVSQQSADFAEAAKSRRPLFFPYFCTFLAPNDFPSFLLQLLLILIIQKPILHQNKLELKHWNQN